MSWPPQAVRAAARRLVLQCPDCPGLGTVRWSDARGRWMVGMWHHGTCPSRRNARQRRAVDRDLTDLLGAALHLSDYDIDCALILAEHRVARAP